jgi:hypothetical protein
VQDNVMALTHEGTGGGAAESVGGAGDEDAGHEMILPPVVVCWHRSAAGNHGDRHEARITASHPAIRPRRIGGPNREAERRHAGHDK